MFWGITLDIGKKYTQIVEKSFHLSMAALGFQTPSESPVTVMVEVNKAQFALCTLQAGRIPQQPLDLNFTEGEEVTFYTEGNGDVHLTGFLQDEPETVEYEDIDENLSSTEASESEESDEEVSDEDSLEGEVSLHDLLEDAAMHAFNGDEDGDGDDDDEDFDPTKNNPGKRKKRRGKIEQKSDEKMTNKDGKKPETDGEKTVTETNSSLSLLDMEFSDDDDDDAWKPKKEKVDKIKILKKQKSKKHAEGEKVNGEAEDGEKVEEEDKEKDKKVSEEGLKKKSKKKRKLKQEDTTAEQENGNVSQEKKQKRTELSESVDKTPESTTNINNNIKNDDGGENEKSSTEKTAQEKNKAENAKTNNVEVLTNGNTAEEGMQSPTKEKVKPPKPEKRTVKGGTIIEDLKVGNGKVAQRGKKVFVYYRGVLAKNQKEFDSCLKGKPFSFLLGRGEVISAWENGVEGMKTGGKRKVTAPPSQAYGSEKLPGIPPNSTLVFEIQLVRVS